MPVATGVPAAIIASHSTGLLNGDGHVRPSFGRRARVLLEFVTRRVAVSRTPARYLQAVTGAPDEQILVIENGIDLAQWPMATPEARRGARDALGIDADEAVVTMVAG